MYLIYCTFIHSQTGSLDSFPQQFLCLLVHAGRLLGDGVLRSVLLLRQALNPPDLREKLADLLVYVPAILLGHDLCGFAFLRVSQMAAWEIGIWPDVVCYCFALNFGIQ